MRKTLLAVVLSVLVLGVAAPASAAPPVREKQSGTYASLYSFSSNCTTDRGRTVCTDINLSASTDPTGVTFVCVSIDSYAVNRDRYTSISSESGCTETTAGVLQISDSMSATLAATTVNVVSYNCNRGRDCQAGGSRDVTVSASDTAVGPVSSSSGRGTFTDGNCTYRYSFTASSAEVAGTITLDGVTYDESGYAEKGDYVTTSRCS